MRKSLITFSELFILLSLLFLLQMVVTAALTDTSPEPFLNRLVVLRIAPPDLGAKQTSFLRYIEVRTVAPEGDLQKEDDLQNQQIRWESSGCFGTAGSNRVNALAVRSARLLDGSCVALSDPRFDRRTLTHFAGDKRERDDVSGFAEKELGFSVSAAHEDEKDASGQASATFTYVRPKKRVALFVGFCGSSNAMSDSVPQLQVERYSLQPGAPKERYGLYYDYDTGTARIVDGSGGEVRGGIRVVSTLENCSESTIPYAETAAEVTIELDPQKGFFLDEVK